MSLLSFLYAERRKRSMRDNFNEFGELIPKLNHIIGKFWNWEIGKLEETIESESQFRNFPIPSVSEGTKFPNVWSAICMNRINEAMLWYNGNYPHSYKNQSPELRAKAVAIANSLNLLFQGGTFCTTFF